MLIKYTFFIGLLIGFIVNFVFIAIFQAKSFEKIWRSSSLVNVINAKSEQEFMILMENLQKERKLTLKKACEKYYNTSQCKRESSFIHDPALFSNSYNFSVCYIHKCGSANWFWAVMTMDGLETISSYDSTFPPKRINLTKVSRSFEYITNQTEKQQKWNNYAKIIQVRHPFDRLVSAYNAKLVPGSLGFTKFFSSISRNINKRYKSIRSDISKRTSSNDTTASFEDFANHILDSRRKDSHWELYSLTCPPCEYEYDYIIKFETFDEDMKYFQIKQNIPHKLMKAFYRKQVLPTNQNKSKAYFDTLSSDLADHLYEMYKPDFELFGYDRPTWFC